MAVKTTLEQPEGYRIYQRSAGRAYDYSATIRSYLLRQMSDKPRSLA